MAGTTLEVRMLGKYSGGGSGPSANGTFIDLTKDNQTVPAVTEPPGTILTHVEAWFLGLQLFLKVEVTSTFRNIPES